MGIERWETEAGGFSLWLAPAFRAGGFLGISRSRRRGSTTRRPPYSNPRRTNVEPSRTERKRNST